jgi:HK97 family phage prohead protease
MEKRFLATHVRAAAKNGKRTIAGYAARYGVLSGPIPSGTSFFRERIERGAFKRILSTVPDVVCLFNHKDDAVLGRTTAGTLRLREDATGLAFECDLPDTQCGRDTYESVQRGDLRGCSFAFQVDEQRHCDYRQEDIEAEEDQDENEKELGLRGKVARKAKELVRSIRDFAGLFDVSVVTHPAYPQTSVAARSKAQLIERAMLLNQIAYVRNRISELEAARDTTADVRLRRKRLAILDL